MNTNSSDNPPLIEVRDLVKNYNGLTAVDGISFNIEQGRCFGLLGPNGAGKTTTVEILEGIKTATRGEIRYKGEVAGSQFRNEMGIMFQTTAIQDFITVRESLELFRNFYPNTTPVEELIEACSLQEFLDRDTRKLSGGQRQRLLLAIALINDPEIIFLDEPTTGLDPRARRNFWKLVRSIKARNKTIVLTTHYMEEAYELCDELFIMDKGKIIAQGAPQNLLSQHFSDVILELPEDALPSGRESLPYSVLERTEALSQHNSGSLLHILTRDMNETIKQLLNVGANLSSLKVRERTLEDLFLEITGKENDSQ
ncbi:MAG: ABC transporter ATP-binding protein [Gammaproteobacteria bacterium]|nr:ABC transporter ATP-binding protein [Gammaproteobacteria bacterium]